MVVSSHKISALSTLRQYVNETICERCELKVGAFPMTERILTRGASLVEFIFVSTDLEARS